jgi:hypothetical protein
MRSPKTFNDGSGFVRFTRFNRGKSRKKNDYSSTDYNPYFRLDRTAVCGTNSIRLMNTTHATPDFPPASAGVPEDAARSALVRYQQAYLVARTLVTVGGVLKGVAVLVFLLTAGVGISFAPRNFDPTRPLLCILGGVIVGALPLLASLLVAASGQMLQAVLDTAVHSSPFLNDSQRAEAMSLCKPLSPAEADENG